MNNATTPARQNCPSWCNSHWSAEHENALDDMHRWIGPVNPAMSQRGDALVCITQGMQPGDEPVLSWNGESHENDGRGARDFAAALRAGAEKLDEIRTGGADTGGKQGGGQIIAGNIARAMSERGWGYEALAEASDMSPGELVGWRADASTMGMDTLWRIARALNVSAVTLVRA